MTTTVPYVSAAAFQAHPTYLDVDDLRNGSSSEADQVAELTNLLLMASHWADSECNQPLGAHTHTQRFRQRLDRYGRLLAHPEHGPVRRVTGISWGYQPTAMNTVQDLSGVWIEDGRQIVVQLPGPSIPASAGLQFAGAGPAGEVYVELTYAAAYVATVLTADATSGATSLMVADPTGIMPGDSYRIWEPGVEETVTVSATWTPPASTTPSTPASVPLAAPTLNAHTQGHDFSGMPANMRLAVINYTVSQLMRPDTAAEDSYPDTQLSSSTRMNDPRKDGSGLVAEAQRILTAYQRVR